MGEYRSQVDGRKLQREMALNPTRVRAVPLSDEAAFDRVMAQLSEMSSEGRKFYQALKDEEALEEAAREEREMESDISSECIDTGGAVAAFGEPDGPLGSESGGGGHGSSQDDPETIDVEARLISESDASAAHDELLVQRSESVDEWEADLDEEDEEDEELLELTERDQIDLFDLALEVVETFNAELAGLLERGDSDGRERQSPDPEVDFDVHTETAESSLAMEILAPAAEINQADGGADAGALVDGAGDGARASGAEDDPLCERVDALGSLDRRSRSAEDMATREPESVLAANDTQTDHQLTVDADFSLLEQVSGATHHFEVISSTSPIRSIELIRGSNGQMMANVVVVQEYAGGLAEFLERMRLRMGRLRLSMLRLIVDERTVAEVHADLGETS